MKLAVDIGNRNICICYNDKGSLKISLVRLVGL